MTLLKQPLHEVSQVPQPADTNYSAIMCHSTVMSSLNVMLNLQRSHLQLPVLRKIILYNYTASANVNNFMDPMIQPESMYVYGSRAKLDTHTDSRTPFDPPASDPDALLSPVTTYEIRGEGWIE